MSQNYQNHRRLVTGYHYIGGMLLLLVLGGGIFNLIRALDNHRKYNAFLIVVLTVFAAIAFYYARISALRAQDRVIRAEENFRHYLLTGKPLDDRLTMRQIIGLRFASDDELVALSQKAIDENLSENAIKKSIKNWRADHERV